MGALAATVPTRTGTASPGAAVAASDTIHASLLGTLGVHLEILNGGGSTDNVTISDAGATPAGTPLSGGTYPGSVANGTNKTFYISPKQADPATQLVTITHSFTTSVTYKLYPLG